MAPADWDSRYSASANLFGDNPSRLLLDHRGLLRPGMEALAVGDGEGRNGVWLAEQGLHVLAVDISPVGLARAGARAARHNVEIVTRCVDILDWDWPVAAFDLVACIYVHFPPERKAQMHQAMVRALKPGGLLIMEAYHRDQLHFGTGGPGDPLMLYTLEELEEAFADCQILVLKQQETDVELDGECKGRGSAVHLVARK